MNRRKTLALLVDNLSSDYVMLVRAAVEREASRRDVHVIVFTGQRLGAPTKLEATQNKIYDLVSSERVDGVLVLSSSLSHYCGEAGIAQLCRSYAPLPVCSVGLEIEGVPSLIVDNAAGMAVGVGHLLDVHGCQRLAFLGGQHGSPESRNRLEGFRKAHADRNLTVDERLIFHAEFTVASGRVATEKLIQSGVDFDGVVAANDYMALAALEILKKHGRDVPGDVVVTGFDDATAASCARPALTTLRQPLRWLGAQAVDLLLRQIEGETVAACTKAGLDLAVRESCGCAGRLPVSVALKNQRPSAILDVLKSDRTRLHTALEGLVNMPSSVLGGWSFGLLDSLQAELEGEVGAFPRAFEQLLADSHDEGADVGEFHHVVTVLRAELRGVNDFQSRESRQFERVLHLARILITTAAIRYVGRELLAIERSTPLLGRSGERFATALNFPSLKKAILEELPELEVRRAAVCLFAKVESGGSDDEGLKVFLALDDGKEAKVPDIVLDPRLLAPDAIVQPQACEHSVVFPLTFESEFFGVGVCAGGAVPAVFGALRQQIGAAIKGVSLHRQIVQHVAMRERSERKQMAQEAELASNIQTSMVPSVFDVPGLSIAASMTPAAEVGGDYYDVVADEQGALIGIGDVTGHGLQSGLIMLMLQSMVAAMARLRPALSPVTMINTINAALFEGIRHRLSRDEHASLTIIRYERDGRLRFAGAHEPLLIYRKRSSYCEIVESPGFWVGAVPDVAHMTTEGEAQLEDGDLLILHTDGVTEARNVHQRQFGLERVASLIEEMGHLPVGAICDRLTEAVRSWTSSLEDDMSLVVIRYSASK